MKKIPSLFKRDYGSGARLVYDEVAPGTEWAHAGEGVATRKIDGTSCLVRDGKLYKRYDAKAGRTPPDSFEPAQDPDPSVLRPLPPGFMPARSHIHICISCFCQVQYQSRTNVLMEVAYATERPGGAAGVQTGILSTPRTEQSHISGPTQQVTQRQTHADLPAVSAGVHRAEG
jgi:hypothetical protein